MIFKVLLLGACLTGDTFYLNNKFLVQDRIETFVIGKPTRKAEWLEPPKIRICAETRIPPYRVSKALAYWRILGYEFGPVTVDDSLVCRGPFRGEIVFMLPTSGFDTSKLASTSLYTHIKEKHIVMAKINITPRSAKKERVIEHEIGHALGWNHYNQKFHIMNSNWMYGGYDSKGLRK